MDIENTAFMAEVRTVLQSGSNPVHYTYSATIHVRETNKNYEATKIVLMDCVSDYETKYADVIMAKLAIPRGTYASYVYPNQSSLDVTVTKTPIGEVGDSINTENKVIKTRYTAVLVDTGNPTLQESGMVSQDEEQKNRTAPIEVYFQLIDKAVDQVRMITTGGIYNGCTMEEVLSGVLTRQSNQVKIGTTKLIKGVNIVAPSNTGEKDSIIIPHGTKLVDLPIVLQKKCGGVYSAGMGYYLWNGYWYVYPCYDVQRYKDSKRNITILNVPSSRMPGVERTYREDGTNIVILATGEVKTRDNTDSMQLTNGVGVRFADGSKMMESSTTTADNKTVVSRSALNTEVLATERKDGSNYSPVSKNAITANRMEELSALTRRMGGLIALVWENSKPELLAPDTMVRLKYLKQGAIKETFGVLLKAHHFTEMEGAGIIAGRYKTSTVLTVFVQDAQG